MKKNIIWLVVILLLAGGMAGALFFLNANPPAVEEPSSAPETVFVTGSYGDPEPERIDVENESGKMVIHGGENPTLEGFEGFSLDTYGLNNVISGGKYLTAKRVVEENADAQALAAYGFDKPRSTVAAKKSNGDVTILIGGEAPGGEGSYVKLKDGAEVYLVSGSLIEPFLRSPLDFINKTITETDPEFTGFDKIVLSGENYPEPITIEKIPEDELDNYSAMVSQRIVTPVQKAADVNIMEPLSSLYGLLAQSVDGIARENSELAQYGLDNPAAVAAITSPKPNLTFTLRFSAPEPDGTVRVVKDGSPVVYKLDSSALPWLDLTLFDYMDKFAVIPHIDKVSTIKLTVGDEVYEFNLAGEGDDLAVTFGGAPLPSAQDENGKEIDSASNFRKFYQTLIYARFEEEAAERPAEGSAPVMSIEYGYKAGGSDAVRFYGGAPTRKMYISANDGDAYLISSSFIDRVAEDVVKLVNGEMVKTII